MWSILVSICWFAGGWFISNPDTLCSSGGNFPYPGGLPLTPHHGYKHYPSLHGHRSAPYPSPYLPRHHHHHHPHHRGHNSGDTSSFESCLSNSYRPLCTFCIKRTNSSKTEIPVIIYSPSCYSKTVWLSFFCGTWKEKCWKMYWSLILNFPNWHMTYALYFQVFYLLYITGMYIRGRWPP